MNCAAPTEFAGGQWWCTSCGSLVAPERVDERGHFVQAVWAEEQDCMLCGAELARAEPVDPASKVQTLNWATFDEARAFAAEHVRGWPAWRVIPTEAVSDDGETRWVIELSPGGPVLATRHLEARP